MELLNKSEFNTLYDSDSNFKSAIVTQLKDILKSAKLLVDNPTIGSNFIVQGFNNCRMTAKLVGHKCLLKFVCNSNIAFMDISLYKVYSGSLIDLVLLDKMTELTNKLAKLPSGSKTILDTVSY